MHEILHDISYEWIASHDLISAQDFDSKWDEAITPFVLYLLLDFSSQANSASGIAVNDECKLTFLELKARRNHRYLTFKIDDGLQQVVVDKIGGQGESYEDFCKSLPDDDCRYAVFDYDFTTDENCHKSKIFFIAW